MYKSYKIKENNLVQAIEKKVNINNEIISQLDFSIVRQLNDDEILSIKNFDNNTIKSVLEYIDYDTDNDIIFIKPNKYVFDLNGNNIEININLVDLQNYINLENPINIYKHDESVSYNNRIIKIIKHQHASPKYVNIINGNIANKIQLTQTFIQLNLAKLQEVDKCISNQISFNEFQYRNPDLIYAVSEELNNLSYFQSLLYKIEYGLFSPNYKLVNDLILQYRQSELTKQDFEMILEENNNFNDTFISEIDFDYLIDAIN